MNCYLIDIRFIRPFESFGAVVTAHRAYLQQGYDQGWLLLSGPRGDKRGGIAIARAQDVAELKAFFAHDPYHLNGMAEYDFVAFTGAKHQPWLSDWINGNDTAHG